MKMFNGCFIFKYVFPLEISDTICSTVIKKKVNLNLVVLVPKNQKLIKIPIAYLK